MIDQTLQPSHEWMLSHGFEPIRIAPGFEDRFDIREGEGVWQSAGRTLHSAQSVYVTGAREVHEISRCLCTSMHYHVVAVVDGEYPCMYTLLYPVGMIHMDARGRINNSAKIPFPAYWHADAGEWRAWTPQSYSQMNGLGLTLGACFEALGWPTEYVPEKQAA